MLGLFDGVMELFLAQAQHFLLFGPGLGLNQLVLIKDDSIFFSPPPLASLVPPLPLIFVMLFLFSSVERVNIPSATELNAKLGN